MQDQPTDASPGEPGPLRSPIPEEPSSAPTPTAIEAAPEPSVKAGSAVGRRTSHPIVPGLSSGLLLYFAFPPADRGYLAWFAMAPLLLLVKSDRPKRSVSLGAWAGGLTFWLLSVLWIWELDPSAWVAWIALATYLSLYWLAFLLLARISVHRLKIPLMLAAPILWVGLEYVQAFALTGFPWYYLAHSQYRYLPLIQICDVTGTWGLSALVMMANACWVELLTTPLSRPTRRGQRLARAQVLRLAVLGLLVAATVGYGAFRLGTARFPEGPRLALLQSNIRQEVRSGHDPNQIIQVYAQLIHRATRDPKERPDLIVWPETSYPRGFVRLDKELDPAEFDRQGRSFFPDATPAAWLRKMSDTSGELHGMVDSLGVPMVVGSLLYDFHRAGPARYNAAILLEPGVESVQVYPKIHLVPFGEYVPLIETIPWITVLTPYERDAMPKLASGQGPVWFDLGKYRFANAICFEDTVADLVRRFFSETPDNHQPDILLNISNDGWFRGSPEHDMHLAVGIFRAVENRAPIVRAVNCGISAVVDGNGRILKSLPKLTEGVLSARVPLDPRTSVYTAWGDWFGQACFAVSLGLLVLWAVGWPRRPRTVEN